LRSAGSGRRILLDIDSVGHKRNPFEECLDVVRHRPPRPQIFKHRDNSLTKIRSQLSYWLESAFDQCHQFSGGELGLEVFAADDLLLHPVLLQRGRRGYVRIREGLCKSNE
jgi:hypothetical protein